MVKEGKNDLWEEERKKIDIMLIMIYMQNYLIRYKMYLDTHTKFEMIYLIVK